MGQAGKYNMTMEKAATFTRAITWKDSKENPVDLTDCTAVMHVRKMPGGSIAMALSTANGRISIEESAGKISLEINATDTLTLSSGIYAYDLLVISLDGIVTRLLEGTFVVEMAVTLP